MCSEASALRCSDSCASCSCAVWCMRCNLASSLSFSFSSLCSAFFCSSTSSRKRPCLASDSLCSFSSFSTAAARSWAPKISDLLTSVRSPSRPCRAFSSLSLSCSAFSRAATLSSLRLRSLSRLVLAAFNSAASWSRLSLSLAALSASSLVCFSCAVIFILSVSTSASCRSRRACRSWMRSPAVSAWDLWICASLAWCSRASCTSRSFASTSEIWSCMAFLSALAASLAAWIFLSASFSSSSLPSSCFSRAFSRSPAPLTCFW
mmetsp:Transcript_27176/g.45531  ORF Transcript_27176/g.45531 Transcript_27176/m.45531 type:complete len:263 (-) Transcript_27176:2946-3734(-)